MTMRVDPWPFSVRSEVAESYGIGYRRGSHPVLLWLWCRLAAAVPVQPLSWELPYAAGAALKKKKKIYEIAQPGLGTGPQFINCF